MILEKYSAQSVSLIFLQLLIAIYICFGMDVFYYSFYYNFFNNSSLIQQIDHKIQISGESDPQQIRDLKVGSSGVKPAELEYHSEDIGPQDYEPYECE